MTKNEMSVVEHLDELRRRLIWSILGVTAGTAVGFSAAGWVLKFLIQPLEGFPQVGKLVFLSPSEAFFAYLKIAFLTGLLLASPLVLYQVGAFVWPALNRMEKRYVVILLPMILLLFSLGVIFSYKVILPLVLRFFMGFSSEELQAFLTLGAYLSFVFGLVLPFGFVFQLPVLSYFLTKIGVISPAFLKRNRKFAVLGIFVIAAFLTPPDVISQVMMAGPLLGLYEIGIWVSSVAARSRTEETIE